MTLLLTFFSPAICAGLITAMMYPSGASNPVHYKAVAVVVVLIFLLMAFASGRPEGPGFAFIFLLFAPFHWGVYWVANYLGTRFGVSKLFAAFLDRKDQ